jgi:hypothetical protein
MDVAVLGGSATACPRRTARCDSRPRIKGGTAPTATTIGQLTVNTPADNKCQVALPSSDSPIAVRAFQRAKVRAHSEGLAAISHTRVAVMA